MFNVSISALDVKVETILLNIREFIMSDNGISSYQLKIKIINFIELAYKENEGVTSSLIQSKGPFTLKINERGEATLSGKSGVVRFDVNDEVKQIGLDIKMVSVMFSGGNEGKLH